MTLRQGQEQITLFTEIISKTLFTQYDQQEKIRRTFTYKLYQT